MLRNLKGRMVLLVINVEKKVILLVNADQEETVTLEEIIEIIITQLDPIVLAEMIEILEGLITSTNMMTTIILAKMITSTKFMKLELLVQRNIIVNQIEKET